MFTSTVQNVKISGFDSVSEINCVRYFHVEVLQWRQRNVQKRRDARAELVANLNFLLCRHSRHCRHLRYLGSLGWETAGWWSPFAILPMYKHKGIGSVVTEFDRLDGKRLPGADSAYERGGDARRKFWFKPLKETDLGVAQAFLIPTRGHVETQTNEKTWIIWME